jgi:hypothetical protein
MKLSGNSAYGKTVKKKMFLLLTEMKIIFLKNQLPHFKDLEELYGQKYEVISTKREIRMDLQLQISVSVYHLAKLRMLDCYYIFIDKYIDRSDFDLLQMDRDSIEKLIKPEMKEEYEKDKYNFLPSESKDLQPTFQVDGVRFTWAQYDKRKPGLFKVKTKKDEMISLCSKIYCASDIAEENN